MPAQNDRDDSYKQNLQLCVAAKSKQRSSFLGRQILKPAGDEHGSVAAGVLGVVTHVFEEVAGCEAVVDLDFRAGLQSGVDRRRQNHRRMSLRIEIVEPGLVDLLDAVRVLVLRDLDQLSNVAMKRHQLPVVLGVVLVEVHERRELLGRLRFPLGIFGKLAAFVSEFEGCLIEKFRVGFLCLLDDRKVRIALIGSDAHRLQSRLAGWLEQFIREHDLGERCPMSRRVWRHAADKFFDAGSVSLFRFGERDQAIFRKRLQPKIAKADLLWFLVRVQLKGNRAFFDAVRLRIPPVGNRLAVNGQTDAVALGENFDFVPVVLSAGPDRFPLVPVNQIAAVEFVEAVLRREHDKVSGAGELVALFRVDGSPERDARMHL